MSNLENTQKLATDVANNKAALYSQQNLNSQFQSFNDEIDLRELFKAIWDGKWIIIIITTLFAISSVIFALHQPNIYKSQATLSSAQSDSGTGGLAALAGQFGGLASMAGIQLGSSGGNQTQLAMQVMKSRQFITNFIEKHQIKADLMAVKEWNFNTNQVQYDLEVYNPNNQTWVREVKLPKKPEPSLQEAYKQFMKIYAVNMDEETGMISISIEHLSPYIAQQWVEKLVIDINFDMKQRDVIEAERGQKFLEEQLKETNIADMRTILYQLMEKTAQTIMFANVRDEYVFKTIDPALVPEEKAKPKRALICILGTLFGGVLSILLVLFRFALTNNK